MDSPILSLLTQKITRMKTRLLKTKNKQEAFSIVYETVLMSIVKRGVPKLSSWFGIHDDSDGCAFGILVRDECRNFVMSASAVNASEIFDAWELEPRNKKYSKNLKSLIAKMEHAYDTLVAEKRVMHPFVGLSRGVFIYRWEARMAEIADEFGLAKPH